MLVIIAACEDPVQPPQPNAGERDELARLQEDRPDEIPFVRISERAPGFAGYYYDERGDLVAVVTDDADRAVVRAEMASPLSQARAARIGATREPQIIFRRGQFTFTQLARWRDLVSTTWLGRHPMLVYVDMDEGRNRVTLGVLAASEGTGRDELRSALERLGIPLEAVHFETTPPIELLAGASASPNHSEAGNKGAMMLDSFSTLRDNASPFMGGLEIQPKECTATLALDFNGSRHLALNSHCTNAMYAVDGIIIFQHDAVSRLGVETQDPPFSYFNGNPSRYSDPALALIDAGVQTRRGAIARPTARNGGGPSGGSGPLTINPARSFFTVTQVEQGQILWAEVQKVGRTTGWTYGPIVATCVDDLGSNGFWRRCSTHAALVAGPGDSGSPVFRWPGADGVTLMGILWGGTGQYATYSGYQSVVRELGGTVNALTDVTVSTPSVSAVVDPSNYRPQLSFSSTTNSPYPSEYRIERQRCPYSSGSPTPWAVVYQGTNTTFTDWEITARYTPSSSYSSCGFSGMYWAAYRVTANNMGVYSPGANVVSFETYQ